MLTDEQIDSITDAEWGFQAVGVMYAAHRAYARAIEAETLKARPQDTRVFDAHIAGLDGWADWVQPKHNGYLLKCCDCGLVHEMEFAVAKYRRDECDECEIVEDKNLRVIFRARREEDIPSVRKIETNPYLKDVQKWDVIG